MFERIKYILANNKMLKHYIIYFFFGCLTTIVGIVSLYLLIKIFPDLNENIANVISIVICIIFAFFTNRSFVFKSKNPKISEEFIKFASGRIGVSFCEIVLFWLLTLVFPKNDFFTLFAKAITCFVAMILNYIISRFFVFKNEIFKET